MINIFHYCGHIISNNDSGRFPLLNQKLVQQNIDNHLKDKKIHSCYGSLASGADIMLANSLIKQGAQLHIVLPFDQEKFLKTSVLPTGKKWLNQFNKLMGKANSITQVYTCTEFDENTSFALCSEIAMGLAVLESFRHNNAKLQQMCLWDKKTTNSIAGTYPDMQRWQVLGQPTNYISTQLPIELNKLSTYTKIDLVSLNLIIIEKNENKNIEINTIKQLITFLEPYFHNNNLENIDFCIDFNQKHFGKTTHTTTEKISQRALGHIAFHYASTHKMGSADSFMNMLLNFNKQKLILMDTQTFCLEDDLNQLKKVIEINATAAMVFYAGRILEATSNYCVKQFAENSQSSVFANIEYINNYQLLDHLTRYWAHALRRLSNQYRHMLKSTIRVDGHIAVMLLELWLDWLINKSPLMTETNQKIGLISSMKNEINQQFDLIKQWIEHKNISKFSQQEINSLLKQPVFASIIIEELINKNHMLEALKSLTIALKQSPDDLRLKQLNGLLLSRNNELEKAEAILKELNKKAPNDEETIGILAGVIKKKWQNGDASSFSRWGKLYLKSWKLSKQKNTYLGINAACYSLWNNKIELSRSIANHIINAFKQRNKTLLEKFNFKNNSLNYWDQATLAEAHLLAGNTKTAQENYQILFESNNYKNMPHEIAAKQLKHHLQYDTIISSVFLEKMVKKYSLS